MGTGPSFRGGGTADDDGCAVRPRVARYGNGPSLSIDAVGERVELSLGVGRMEPVWRTRPADLDYDLVEIPLDGSPIRPLLASRLPEHSVHYSPRAPEFAYTAAAGGGEIRIRQPATLAERVVVSQSDFPDQKGPGRFAAAAFSPDGTKLAYNRNFDIWISAVERRRSGTAHLRAGRRVRSRMVPRRRLDRLQLRPTVLWRAGQGSHRRWRKRGPAPERSLRSGRASVVA